MHAAQKRNAVHCAPHFLLFTDRYTQTDRSGRNDTRLYRLADSAAKRTAY